MASNIHTTSANAVMLVWGSLGLAQAHPNHSHMYNTSMLPDSKPQSTAFKWII